MLARCRRFRPRSCASSSQESAVSIDLPEGASAPERRVRERRRRRPPFAPTTLRSGRRWAPTGHQRAVSDGHQHGDQMGACHGSPACSVGTTGPAAPSAVSEAEVPRRRVPERLRLRDVAPDRLHADVTGRSHDRPLRCAVVRRGRAHAPAQAVPRVVGAGVAEAADVLLHDPGDRLGPQAGVEDVAVAVHRAQERPAGDARRVEPAPHRPDRARRLVLPVGDLDVAPGALLVDLGAAKVDEEPVGVVLEVLDVEADELAASEPAGVAEEQETAVAPIDGPLAERRDDSPEVARGHALLLGRGDAEHSSQARHRLPHERVRGRVGRAGHPVRLRDRRQPPAERADPPGGAVLCRIGQVDQVAGHRRRRTRASGSAQAPRTM